MTGGRPAPAAARRARPTTRPADRRAGRGRASDSGSALTDGSSDASSCSVDTRHLCSCEPAPARDRARATMFRMRISVTSVSAAPQARVTSRSCAWPTSAKICAGSEFIRPLRLNVVPWTIAAVNSSGAVSPAPRAIASSEPVIRPGAAVGSTTLRDDLPARGAERERRLAQAVGHEQQDDLGRARDDRQHQQRERERALPAGEARPADLRDHERDVDEQAEDDRRDAGHHVDEVAHDGREAAGPAVLDEVERDADADRDRRPRTRRR